MREVPVYVRLGGGTKYQRRVCESLSWSTCLCRASAGPRRADVACSSLPRVAILSSPRRHRTSRMWGDKFCGSIDLVSCTVTVALPALNVLILLTLAL